jgi:hypothetical protein
MRLGIDAWSQSSRSFSTKSLSSEYVFGDCVANLTWTRLHSEGEEPFVVYDLMQSTVTLDNSQAIEMPWINLATTGKSGAAMPIANITCPIAIAGEY